MKQNNEDKNVDLVLRPTNWSEYVGQEKVKKNLRMIMDAAKKRGEVCDHLLFYGQAGLGKTTLVNLLAKEMGTGIKTTTGPALEKAGDGKPEGPFDYRQRAIGPEFFFRPSSFHFSGGDGPGELAFQPLAFAFWRHF